MWPSASYATKRTRGSLTACTLERSGDSACCVRDRVRVHDGARSLTRGRIVDERQNAAQRECERVRIARLEDRAGYAILDQVRRTTHCIRYDRRYAMSEGFVDDEAPRFIEIGRAHV